MVRSMTGFGRGKSQNEHLSFTVEIKTVNHRFLEPQIRMSKRFMALENDVRAELSKFIVRGKVDVAVTYEELESTAVVTVDESEVAQYIDTLRDIGQRHGLKDDLAVSDLLAIPELFQRNQPDADLETLRPLLLEAVDAAITDLNEMRSREGARIGADLNAKADDLLLIVQELQAAEPQMEETYRKKLEERVSELLTRMGNGVSVDRGILENEIALYADHACVDEELVRLTSHIRELKDLLTKDEPVGRPLDFLLQEFNREANTIASKAGELSVTQKALLLKKEIEKIREQIQNLE